MRGDAKLVVTDDDTCGRPRVRARSSVLGSPRLIALCEEATVRTPSPTTLEDGTTTVGMRVQFDHLQPTPVGAEVFAEAVLRKIDGRRLKFEVSATDSGGLVAAGKITRVVVGDRRLHGQVLPAAPDAVIVTDCHPSTQRVASWAQWVSRNGRHETANVGVQLVVSMQVADVIHWRQSGSTAPIWWKEALIVARVLWRVLMDAQPVRLEQDRRRRHP